MAVVAAIFAAKRVAKSVLIYQVASPAQAGILAGLGASHASVVGNGGRRSPPSDRGFSFPARSRSSRPQRRRGATKRRHAA